MPAERQFTITRTFDAPRALVFQAWTDPTHMVAWWGPAGFTTPASTISVDLRPGGRWHATLVRDSDGATHPTGGVYREVRPPERLVFTWGDPDAPAGGPDESVVTVTFAELDGKTEMTFHQAGFDSDAARGDVEDGWTTCIDRLPVHLSTIRSDH